ncbi:MAG: hypothetical protein V2A54_10710, partial [Bacteroidota bacterium]
MKSLVIRKSIEEQKYDFFDKHHECRINIAFISFNCNEKSKGKVSGKTFFYLMEDTDDFGKALVYKY